MITRTTSLSVLTQTFATDAIVNRRPKQPTPARDSHGALAATTRALASKSSAGHDAMAAKRAGEKMNALLLSISSSSNLESALARLLQVQSKQKRSTVKDGERSIKNNYLKMKGFTEKKLEAIENRRKAEESKGFWKKFLNVCDAVLKCSAAVVAGCAGGTAGIVAATLLISSVIVANTVKTQTGGWVAAGLGATGGLCMSEASSFLMATAMKYVKKANLYANALVAVPSSDAEKDALQAQTRIAEIDTDKARARYSIDEARGQLEQAINAMNRSSKLVNKLVETRNQMAAEAAV